MSMLQYAAEHTSGARNVQRMRNQHNVRTNSAVHTFRTAAQQFFIIICISLNLLSHYAVAAVFTLALLLS